MKQEPDKKRKTKERKINIYNKKGFIKNNK